MFELEVGYTVVPDVPEDIRQEFARTRSNIAGFSITPWEEHCTECAMPACYQTCDLYEARRDGKCRRFRGGIQIVPIPTHPQGYLAGIHFKRWGQLLAYTESTVLPLETAERLERRSLSAERFVARAPGASISIAGRRGIFSRLARRWKHYVARNASAGSSQTPAESFLVEVYNPQQRVAELSLGIINSETSGALPYQRHLSVDPGVLRLEIPVSEIKRFVDIQRRIHVTITPNLTDPAHEGFTIWFGLVAFIARATSGASDKTTASVSVKTIEKNVDAVKPIKVAVWDLDSTVWRGTLVEDGLQGIHLNEEMASVIRELDSRGIVNSVLSKNDEHDAMEALRQFSLAELFVFPSIDWTEKGSRLSQIVRAMNVAVDTFAFIDDQEFERDQVKAQHPSVRTYDPAMGQGLLNLPEFNPSISGESANRRRFYKAEEQRLQDAEKLTGDYLFFLRSCEMQIIISRLQGRSLGRVQELVQRTNQLNYSGTHYSREEVETFLENPQYEGYVVRCRDRYGDYGTVGFALVDIDAMCLRDAMFSCRIQLKRVEHAVISQLLAVYKAKAATHFSARFIETPKNRAAASVFDDLGFVEASRNGNKRTYVFDLGRAIPEENIAIVQFDESGQ